MELQQLDSTLAEVTEIVLQFFRQRVMQIGAVGLELLEFAAFCACGDAGGEEAAFRGIGFFELTLQTPSQAVHDKH